MDPKSSDGVLIRRGQDIERRAQGRPLEDRSRHWSDVSTNQGMPGTAGSHQELGEKGEQILLGAPEGTNPHSTSILDF